MEPEVHKVRVGHRKRAMVKITARAFADDIVVHAEGETHYKIVTEMGRKTGKAKNEPIKQK